MPLSFLLLVATDSLLDGQHDIWAFLAEPLAVEMLNILREWHLPRLLVVVVHLAELGRIHSQLARHLDLGMGKTMPLASVYPGLQLLARLLLGHAMHLTLVADGETHGTACDLQRHVRC